MVTKKKKASARAEAASSSANATGANAEPRRNPPGASNSAATESTTTMEETNQRILEMVAGFSLTLETMRKENQTEQAMMSAMHRMMRRAVTMSTVTEPELVTQIWGEERPMLASMGRILAKLEAIETKTTKPNTGSLPIPKSYAAALASAVAANRNTTDAGPAQQYVPTQKLTRITISTGRLADEYRNRSLQDTEKVLRDCVVGIKAINELRSGDLQLIFDSPASAGRATANRRWVTTVFGDVNALRETTVPVLAKGIPKAVLQEMRINKDDPKKYIDHLQQRNNIVVVSYDARPPRDINTRLGCCLVRVPDYATADKLVKNGLLLGTSLFQCEPYHADLAPTQCFRCWRYGHVARRCNNPEVCPDCGADHPKTDHCPDRRKFCQVCHLTTHSSRDRSRCKVAKNIQAEARARYETRPRVFVFESSPPPAPLPDTANTPEFIVRDMSSSQAQRKKRRHESPECEPEAELPLLLTAPDARRGRTILGDPNGPLYSDFDLLALQEPMAPGHEPPCPRSCNFELIRGIGRVATYINKRHLPSTYTYDNSSPDITRVTLGDITIINLYSPISEAGNWPSPLISLLDSPCPSRYTAVVGDFNLHHPLWDRHSRTTAEAETLLQLAQHWSLYLLTPPGTPTRPMQTADERDSTIDLAWTTSTTLFQYADEADYEGSDHRPQILTADFEPDNLPRDRGFNWNYLDVAKAKLHASRFITEPCNITTNEQLDEAATQLTKELTQVASLAAPRKAPFQPRRPQNTWWSSQARIAKQELTQARRAFKASPLWPGNYERYLAAEKHFKATVDHCKKASWRVLTATADVKGEDKFRRKGLAWTLEKAMRSKDSHKDPKLPSLRTSPDTPLCSNHSSKAAILADRFFPSVEPKASALHRDTNPPPLEINLEIHEEDVREALRHTANKAAGPDGLKISLMKACGRHFITAFTKIAQASIALGYVPREYRTAQVVVLPKPGKSAEAKHLPNAWRPISLLSTQSKLLEKIISTRITNTAEALDLIPATQHGNRAAHGTETAVKEVVATVEEAWKHRGEVSLLQLDLKGAFDTVSHEVLLCTLHNMGFPHELLTWLKAWLTDREARLHFDGETTIHRTRAGVPQGSPLSPILFVLFQTPLYDKLHRQSNARVVGYADDTNLLAVHRTNQGCVQDLEKAYYVAAEWAEERGMTFEPGKSELIHFTRKHRPHSTTLTLTGPGNGPTVTLAPTENARFLGLWLDRKLNWNAHVKAAEAKLEWQKLALTRLCGKTWGCSLEVARRIYVVVIRSLITYCAAAFHDPSKPRIARALDRCQSGCLRVVTGGYRASPIQMLQLDTHCAPLPLYLNKRTADFNLRDRGSKARVTRHNARLWTATRLADLRRGLRGRRMAPPAPDPDPDLDHWTDQYLSNRPPPPPPSAAGGKKITRTEMALREDWKQLFSATATPRARATMTTKPFHQGALELHRGLTKAQSSLLTQARTGKIGLKAFLFERRVPEHQHSPICPCGIDAQTVEHLFTECTDRRSRHLWAFGFESPQEVLQAFSTKGQVAQLTTTLARSGWLPEYGLYNRLRWEERKKIE